MRTSSKLVAACSGARKGDEVKGGPAAGAAAATEAIKGLLALLTSTLGDSTFSKVRFCS